LDGAHFAQPILSDVPANADGSPPVLSDDGRCAALGSSAGHRAAGEPGGFLDGVFVHDRAAGETSRASVDSPGAEEDGDGNDRSIAVTAS